MDLQDRSGRVRKISPPPGFDARTVQPVRDVLYHYVLPAHSVRRVAYPVTELFGLADVRRVGKASEHACGQGGASRGEDSTTDETRCSYLCIEQRVT